MKSKTHNFKLLLALAAITLGFSQVVPSIADTGGWNKYLYGGVDRTLQRQQPPLDGNAARNGLISGEAMEAFATEQPLLRQQPQLYLQPPVQYRTNIKKQNLNLNAGTKGGRTVISVKDLQMLSNNDIAILIDKSWSMGNRTHPGGMKRWQWCQQQLMGFTSQTAQAFPRGIDVVLFDDDFVVYPNVDMNAVRDIFATFKTGDGTDLKGPLQTVFDEHFKRRYQGSNRNLVVIIISDVSAKKGMSVIKDAMPRVTRPNEISVTYLNLKTSEKDNYMPFVTTGTPIKVEQIAWDTVNALGLTQTILNVIRANQ